MASKTALVTGGNRGIGFETCRQLAARGYQVLLTARVAEQAQQAAATLRRLDLPVEAETLDVSSDASVAACLQRLSQRSVAIDVLVNNAGAIFNPRAEEGSPSPTLEVPAETLLQAFNLNALGAYRLCVALLPQMSRRGYGRIVNVSSGMGALNDMGDGYPAYRVSKTALLAVTRVLHHEARGDVKINAVCPGWVRTDMGGANATRSVEEGAAGVVWAATLPADGPSGGFFRDGTPLQW